MTFELAGEIKLKYNGQIVMSEQIYDVLEIIDDCHSLKLAVQELNLNYKSISKKLNNARKAGFPLTYIKKDKKGINRTCVTKKAYSAMNVWVEANDFLFESIEGE